jgi:hypothetical protein
MGQTIPSPEALRALLAHHARTVEVLEGCIDLIQSACPSASMWDEEGGLADQADALAYMEQRLRGLDLWAGLAKGRVQALADGLSASGVDW